MVWQLALCCVSGMDSRLAVADMALRKVNFAKLPIRIYQSIRLKAMVS